MRHATVILVAIASVLVGIMLGSASATLQQSDATGAGLLAAVLSLGALLTTACPVALGATWVLDRFQQGRLRRQGCI